MPKTEFAMRTFYLLTAFIAWSSSSVIAEDFCVQVRTIVDGKLNHDGQPILLKNTEILAIPGNSFHARLREGDTTVTVDGKLSEPVPGTYLVEFEQVRTNALNPNLRQVTTCRNEVELNKPTLIALSRDTARWTGARGRVHNSWTYQAATRIELVVKKPDEEKGNL
jgi:hypothetical protein